MDPYHSAVKALNDYSWRYKTSTGVTPNGRKFAYVPVNSIYGDNQPSAPTVIVATDVPSAIAENLQGAGPADNDEAVDKLKPEELKDLQSTIQSTAQRAAKRGPLKVQSFKAGKKPADKEAEQALQEEGYGKRKKKSSKHTLTFC